MSKHRSKRPNRQWEGPVTLLAPAKRLETSRNGNPRYQLYIESEGERLFVSTATDAGWVYGISWGSMKAGDTLFAKTKGTRLDQISDLVP